MSYYHVSCKDYEIGQTISANNFANTEYYENAVNMSTNWIDDYLDDSRPENAPERKKTLFAFDKLENAAAFKNKCEGEVFFYKVDMANPIAAPMCLTDVLVVNDDELNQRVKEEYWNSTKDWKYLEYLSTEMVIVTKLNKPNFIQRSKGLTDYISDKELAKDM